jgi:flagellar biosynthesis anti-sigma factor FlgM
MKIEDPRSVNATPLLRQTPAANSGPAKPEVQHAQNGQNPVGQPAVRVEFSNRSREMHQALAAAHASPDVRADKVADAKQRIAQGTYTVNAEAVARGILDKPA